MADTVSALKEDGKFTAVLLDSGNKEMKKKKEPRRIIHFSDGVLEEYSTDEEEEREKEASKIKTVVDPKSLRWGPWLLHFSSSATWKGYRAAHFCGEKLAWFFGITSPKYHYEIEEYKRRVKEIKEEEEEEQRRQEKARQGLSTVDVHVTGGNTNPAMTMDDEMPQPQKEGDKY